MGLQFLYDKGWKNVLGCKAAMTHMSLKSQRDNC